MNPQLKKLFSVTVALALGLVVVSLAWKERAPKEDISFNPTIEGSDWQNTLSSLPASSTQTHSGANQANPTLDATTTTALVARDLLINYASLQKNTGATTINDADAQALAQISVKKIDLPQSTQYSLKNLALSSDNSNVALATYVKNVSDVMQSFSSAHTVKEITVVADAFNTEDASKLKKLTPIIASYKNLQKQLVAVTTPSSVAPLHLRLVQSYANIEASIMGMQKIISDPIVGLAALDQYRKESTALEALAVEYQNYSPIQ